jgi:hypothetical protein
MSWQKWKFILSFSDAPHLKMLYMDFRARLYAPQMMMASIPVECNLKIKVVKQLKW